VVSYKYDYFDPESGYAGGSPVYKTLLIGADVVFYGQPHQTERRSHETLLECRVGPGSGRWRSVRRPGRKAGIESGLRLRQNSAGSHGPDQRHLRRGPDLQLWRHVLRLGSFGHGHLDG